MGISISGENIIETLPLFAELASLYEHAGDPDDVIIGRYLYFYTDGILPRIHYGDGFH